MASISTDERARRYAFQARCPDCRVDAVCWSCTFSRWNPQLRLQGMKWLQYWCVTAESMWEWRLPFPYRQTFWRALRLAMGWDMSRLLTTEFTIAESFEVTLPAGARILGAGPSTSGHLLDARIGGRGTMRYLAEPDAPQVMRRFVLAMEGDEVKLPIKAPLIATLPLNSGIAHVFEDERKTHADD